MEKSVIFGAFETNYIPAQAGSFRDQRVENSRFQVKQISIPTPLDLFNP